MEFSGGVNPYDSHRYGFGAIDTIQRQRSVSTSRHRAPVSVHRDQSIHTMQQVMRMREAVKAIKPEMLEPQEIQIASPASATSATSLGLDMTATATTLQSTEEINTTPTSYSTHGPEWTGSSTAQVTISGEYDGSNGSDTLTFEVNAGGTHGVDDLQIKVFDSNTNEIDQFDIKKEDPVDKPYTLSNGLIVTLSEGDLVKPDTLTLDVYDSAGTAVDPDNPFNGMRTDDPDLQPGLSVSDGSFQINGSTIDVNASDSINDVLDRINQSNAGVSATFDAGSESVLLTQNTTGSTPDIVLENDTSGFLAAMKLDGATATPGEDAETDKSMSGVASFSTVQNGNISVNGVSIDIDVNADSLNDVLDRISASAAEVTASFDSASQKVTLTSDDADSQMTLSDGGTQFFSAVGISEGVYNSQNDVIEAQAQGVNVVDVTDLIVDAIVDENAEKPWEIEETESTPVAAADGKMLTALVKNIAHSMNALFDDSAFKDSPGAFLEDVRSGIRTAVSSSFGSEGPRFNTDFGIQFDFSQNNGKVFNFSADNQQQFETTLATREGAAAVRNTLFANESQGLFNQLHTTLTASASAFENQSDATGIFVDVSI